MELYLKVRLACSGGMSRRQAAKHFNISRDSVAKMMAYSTPPGYQRQSPIRRPKLDAYVSTIDHWLDEDVKVPRKQRHTAKRVFGRLRDERGFTGGYTIIKDYMREREQRRQEVFMPLSHAPGHGQADFGGRRSTRHRIRCLTASKPIAPSCRACFTAACRSESSKVSMRRSTCTYSRRACFAMRPSIRRRSVANSSGSSQPWRGAA